MDFGSVGLNQRRLAILLRAMPVPLSMRINPTILVDCDQTAEDVGHAIIGAGYLNLDHKGGRLGGVVSDARALEHKPVGGLIECEFKFHICFGSTTWNRSPGVVNVPTRACPR